jgi:hypothetical protein
MIRDALSEQDILTNKIISFGDGPASFNAEATKKGSHIVSVDPIYKFSIKEIEDRIYETKDIILEQARINEQNYKWTNIKNLKELEHLRMSAMRLFLDDFEQGLSEKRYVCGELPDRIMFPNDSFDIGLSSHFLLLYSGLGRDFHIHSIKEMLRVCREIRIFPICNLDSYKTDLLNEVIDYFSKTVRVGIVPSTYEFQKNANEMLIFEKVL